MLEALGFVTDAPYRRYGLGYYRRILLARSTDDRIRRLSHDGGVIMALLKYAMEEGIINSAVSSERDERVPIKIKPTISLVPDDVLSHVSMKFFPSAVATAFGNLVYSHEEVKAAFVGTPCQILALRKLESWEHKIVDSLKLVIGLICLWCFSLPRLLKHFNEVYGIKPREIQRISLDGKYDIHLKDKVIKVPIEEVEPYILPSCRTCMDATSELADISVGGATPLKEWSVVIIRTGNGEEIFNSAVENDAIRTKSLEEEPEVFENLMKFIKFKKDFALREIERRKALDQPIPPAITRITMLNSREEAFLSSLTIEEVMTKDVISLPPKTTVEELEKMMIKGHHVGYPVVDEKGKLIGIVTFEDMIKVPPEKRSETRVEEIASKKLIIAYPDESVLEAYKKMMKYKIGRILIVEKENPTKLIGIITRTDVMHTLRWPMKIK